MDITCTVRYVVLLCGTLQDFPRLLRQKPRILVPRERLNVRELVDPNHSCSRSDTNLPAEVRSRSDPLRPALRRRCAGAGLGRSAGGLSTIARNKTVGCAGSATRSGRDLDSASRGDGVGLPGGCKTCRLGAPSTVLPVLGEGLPPCDLLQHVANKQRVVDKVAVSESARLGHQPEHPFQPRAL